LDKPGNLETKISGTYETHETERPTIGICLIFF